MTASASHAAPAARIRVLCADDHPMLRAGLAAVIEDEPDMEVIAEAADGAEALELYRGLRPDVVLMDLRMPVMGGLEATRAIRTEFPDAAILVLTSYSGDDDVRKAMEAGARGYLLKETLRSEVVSAIRATVGGRRTLSAAAAEQLAEHLGDEALSARELDVLQAAAAGLRNKEIAYRLGITEATVKAHMANLMDKLGAHDRTHAVTIALRRGLLHLD